MLNQFHHISRVDLSFFPPLRHDGEIVDAGLCGDLPETLSHAW
jgi:hypothetical protein